MCFAKQVALIVYTISKSKNLIACQNNSVLLNNCYLFDESRAINLDFINMVFFA